MDLGVTAETGADINQRWPGTGLALGWDSPSNPAREGLAGPENALAPGGPGIPAAPGGGTREGWCRPGQKFASRAGEKGYRAEAETQDGSEASTPRTSLRTCPRLPRGSCSRSQIYTASGLCLFGTACGQCHLHWALWVLPPRPPIPGPSPPFPRRGPCDASPQRACTLYPFFLFPSPLTGHRAEHTGTLAHADRGHAFLLHPREGCPTDLSEELLGYWFEAIPPAGAVSFLPLLCCWVSI